jgi:ribonuclease-3
MEFRDIKQERDENKSPVFTTQVFIEGLEGCVGTGYSKKESQQNASKDTLQRLRREPQFIDAVFAAKGDRTKMEEEPVGVPEQEMKQDFILSNNSNEDNVNQSVIDNNETTPKTEVKKNNRQATEQQSDNDEFDLSDISMSKAELSREEIIAAAEAAAFNC